MLLKTPPIHIKAGPQRVTAAFVQHFDGPDRRPHGADRPHARRQPIGTGFGITTLPHLQDMTLVGPHT